MAVETRTDQRPEKSQTDEPAKGSIKPAHKTSYPSRDGLKREGDKLQHAVDEAAKPR